MISLSRLFKSQWLAQTEQEQKLISIKSFQPVGGENQTPAMIQLEQREKAILAKAEQEAEMIRNEAALIAQSAQEKIHQEKQAWEQEKLTIAEAAKQEGYQAGLALGKEHGYQAWTEEIQNAKEIVHLAKKAYQQQIELAEKTILFLGIKVAEQIIGKKLEDSEETFLSIVKRALKEAREYREVQLRVFPGAYGFILEQKEELMAIFPKETDLYIYPDEQLSEGNCVIESANGRIDAAIDSQLQEIKTKLLDLLEGESQ